MNPCNVALYFTFRISSELPNPSNLQHGEILQSKINNNNSAVHTNSVVNVTSSDLCQDSFRLTSKHYLNLVLKSLAFGALHYGTSQAVTSLYIIVNS